jgi:N-acetylmuramoyl-L-alanine amidase-like
MKRAAKTAALVLLASALGAPARAAAPVRFRGMNPRELNAALQDIDARSPGLQGRIEAVSAAFLGTPYVLGPLGEGPQGRFDRDPLISFDALDCTTFVEETMALSLSPDLASAKDLLRRIRYKDGRIAYASRNHFTSADWVPNNVAAGFLRDVTRDVAGADVQIASKTISKRTWYAGKTLADLQGLDSLTPAERSARLREFRALGAAMPDETVSLPYLPIALLPKYASRIPSGTIANLVREDQPDKPVLVSHQLLIIDEGGAPYVREAAWKDEVKDIPLLDYFKIYDGSKWPLLGLNLNEILPQP